MTKTQVRYGDELCRWLGYLMTTLCTLAKLMNFAKGTSMAKKILRAWADSFSDANAVKHASGCWPKALTDRWYSTAADKSAFSCIKNCSRFSQALGVFRKVVSDIKAKATSNQTKSLVTQENTKEMLTAVDTAGTSNEPRAQFQARESRWQRELMESVSVLAIHFVIHVSHWSRGPADHAFYWGRCSINEVCCW